MPATPVRDPFSLRDITCSIRFRYSFNVMKSTRLQRGLYCTMGVKRCVYGSRSSVTRHKSLGIPGVSRGQSDPNQDGGQPALRHKSPHCRVIIQGKGLLTLVRNGCFMNCVPLTAAGLVIIYYVFIL